MVVDSYEFGKIVINGNIYEKDLIIYPDKINSDWWREDSHLVSPNDLKTILDNISVQKSSNGIIMLIGTGSYGEMRISGDVVDALNSKGVKVICEPTNTACELYNKISRKGRIVIAALHLTC